LSTHPAQGGGAEVGEDGVVATVDA
jgi:hypothetical protein